MPAAMTLDRLDAQALRAAVVGYRDALRAHQDRLNRLNVYPVPDGDTGTNMALTLESVVAELDTEPGAGHDLAALGKALSHGSLMGARGNSGVILSQILRGLADSFKAAGAEAGAVDALAMAGALTAAAKAAYSAVMKPVEGTILTVAREAAEGAEAAAAGPDPTLTSVLDSAASAARRALDRTPELLPVLAAAGVVDAGGAGFILLLDSLLSVVDGRSVPDAGPPGPEPVTVAPLAAPHGEGDISDLRYEVMFLLEGAADEAVEEMKQAWAALGDSIVVVGGDGLWNCHVHTDEAGAAVEAGIAAGRPRAIRITDLRDQVEEERWVRQAASSAPPAAASAVKVATAVVAVATGDGVAEILRSLGAGRVVAGGPSMNPSTAQLLEAVEALDCDGAVILPNNGNVVAVAEQVGGLATKPVAVVRTVSVPEGMAALMGYDPGADVGANAEAMAESAACVRWGEVTWAVRDAVTPAGPVKEGEYLGLVSDVIGVVGPDRLDVACRLAARLVSGGQELLTVLVGEGVAGGEAAALAAWLADHHPGVGVEIHAGGQPLSSYLFSAE